jgi:hypothetical protein
LEEEVPELTVVVEGSAGSFWEMAQVRLFNQTASVWQREEDKDLGSAVREVKVGTQMAREGIIPTGRSQTTGVDKREEDPELHCSVKRGMERAEVAVEEDGLVEGGALGESVREEARAL